MEMIVRKTTKYRLVGNIYVCCNGDGSGSGKCSNNYRTPKLRNLQKHNSVVHNIIHNPERRTQSRKTIAANSPDVTERITFSVMEPPPTVHSIGPLSGGPCSNSQKPLRIAQRTMIHGNQTTRKTGFSGILELVDRKLAAFLAFKKPINHIPIPEKFTPR